MNMLDWVVWLHDRAPGQAFDLSSLNILAALKESTILTDRNVDE